MGGKCDEVTNGREMNPKEKVAEAGAMCCERGREGVRECDAGTGMGV